MDKLKFSPDGNPHPQYILDYLAAREVADLNPPAELWDKRNGWVHYRDKGGLFSFRPSQIKNMTLELRARKRA